MDELEITTLPIADRRVLPKMNTLGYDADGNATQVRFSDLLPRTIRAASIDYLNGLLVSRTPFVAGTSEVYLNGLRCALNRDYKELTDGTKSDGIEIPGIDSDDDIVLKAIPFTE